MTINRLTYEAFLLDFAEGRLTAEEIILLKRFIKMHPELGSWEELTEELPVLAGDEYVTFENKERLKAPFLPERELKINSENFDSFAIAYLENELNTTEKRSFDLFLESNKSFQQEFLLLQKTILRPDKNIQFLDKEALKIKSGRKVALFLPWIGVAAGLLLLMSVGWWLLPDPSNAATQKQAVYAMSSIRAKQINLMQTTEQDVTLAKPAINPPASQIPEIDFSESNPIYGNMALAEAKPFTWTPVASLFYTDESKTLYYFYDGSAILAELNEQTHENQRSLAGLILSNTAGKIIQKLSKPAPVLEEVTKESMASNSPKYSLIKLAEVGIKTFNTMTDNELALEKTLNEKGEISRLRFHTESISISRKVKDPKTQQ